MEYDLIIIGSGPGGYVPAIRAGQIGLRAVIVEKDKIGGMCLNHGCIPTKSLIESGKLYRKIKGASKFGIDGIEPENLSFNFSGSVKRTKRIVSRLTKGVDFLLKKHGVEVIAGRASIKDQNSIEVNNRMISADNIIIATGSVANPLPEVFTGFETVDIREMLELESIPENIVIYGSGVHSTELAQFFSMTDRKVTMISPGNATLDGLDDFILDQIQKRLKKENISIVSLEDVRVEKKSNLLAGDIPVPADLIINGGPRIGVVPPSEINIGLKDGFIATDEKFSSGTGNIFAVGDVNGKSYFAHAASAQGLFVVNYIRGVDSIYDPKNVPFNIYTYPEIAQVGHTEKDLIEQQIEYKVSEFSLTANGKALIEGESDGLVRILSEIRYGEVLGVQIIAQNATDMIAEASALMSIEGTVFDIANIIHAHPTVSEVFYEAGLDALDIAIHK